jgi:hypothetical protein
MLSYHVSPHGDITISTSAQALGYAQRNQFGDLEQAITYDQQAVDLTPSPPPPGLTP